MRARATWAVIFATGFEGIRAGAGTFRALLDLPARHDIGPLAFADLSRATDLSSTGVAFYALYGLGGAIVTGVAWTMISLARGPTFARRACALSFACSLLVLVLTTQAAPLMWQVGGTHDPVVLTRLLDAFTAWTLARIALADVSFVSMLAALGSVALGSVAPASRAT